MKRNYTILALILIISIVFSYRAGSNTRQAIAKIHNKIYRFELAETTEERSKGLMHREQLDDDGGMLFIFNKSDYLTFYMKNTFIPLEVAFIDENFTIVDFRALKPLDLTYITSRAKALYALEVNKGFFERVGLGVGDRLEFVIAE
ncbi:DUF192 domain-containing protein [Candidatus Omnitrophota bacterium]